MSFGPGGANASSAAQPAAAESFQIISAVQPYEPAAQPVQYPYSCCCLDVRWQVEHSSGQWWDIPQSADVERYYKASVAGFTYTYDWGTAGSVAMSSTLRSVSR